jgi:hypothetical protein
VCFARTRFVTVTIVMTLVQIVAQRVLPGLAATRRRLPMLRRHASAPAERG